MLFAENAAFVDVFGNWFKDRTAIERTLAQRHAIIFRNSRQQDLAIVHSVIELSGAVDLQGQQLPPGLGVITSVIEKGAGGGRSSPCRTLRSLHSNLVPPDGCGVV